MRVLLAFSLPLLMTAGFLFVNWSARDARHHACESANERWTELGDWLRSFPPPTDPVRLRQYENLLRVTRPHQC